MENFYTIYDATDPNQLKIGLVVPVYSMSTSALIKVLALSGLTFCLVFMISVMFLICHRNSKKKKLEEAKNYLETLKNVNHDDPEEVVAKRQSKKRVKTDEEEEDEELSTTNPNTFLSKRAFDDSEEEEVSS